MARSRPKSRTSGPTKLVAYHGRRSARFVMANPWRAVVLAAGVLLIAFGGIRFYQYSEAATLEELVNKDCNMTSYGVHANPTQAKCIAKKVLMPTHGWTTAPQYDSLVSLWDRESGWRWSATNPGSGAYGIPQSLPPSKMGTVYCGHGSYWNNAECQIRWGLKYIDGRYGSPRTALEHENRYGWY